MESIFQSGLVNELRSVRIIPYPGMVSVDILIVSVPISVDTKQKGQTPGFSTTETEKYTVWVDNSVTVVRFLVERKSNRFGSDLVRVLKFA